MLTTELSASVERTLITIVAFLFCGAILLRFGLTTESVTITLPILTAVMAYWFAGSTQPPKPPSGGNGA